MKIFIATRTWCTTLTLLSTCTSTFAIDDFKVREFCVSCSIRSPARSLWKPTMLNVYCSVPPYIRVRTISIITLSFFKPSNATVVHGRAWKSKWLHLETPLWVYFRIRSTSFLQLGKHQRHIISYPHAQSASSPILRILLGARSNVSPRGPYQNRSWRHRRRYQPFHSTYFELWGGYSRILLWRKSFGSIWVCEKDWICSFWYVHALLGMLRWLQWGILRSCGYYLYNGEYM